jgi:tRNA nucleotidyltransferase (CCA-adding enzyme)
LSDPFSLIIKYNDFHQLLNQVKTWKEGIKISLTKYNIPHFEDSLIFIDPVDKDRNVAAAVSPRTFHQFIKASKAYIHQPKYTFFYPKPIQSWSLTQIKDTLHEKQATFIGIRFTKPNIIKENLYPQLRKTCTTIKKQSEEEGFTIHDIQFYINELSNMAYIIIKTDDEPLSESYTHIGPPVTLKKNTQEFIDKWINHPATITQPFQRNGRTYVIVKRKYRYLTHYLQDTLPDLSLGKHIDQMVLKDYTLLTESQLINPELQQFWTSYLENKNPWDR